MGERILDAEGRPDPLAEAIARAERAEAERDGAREAAQTYKWALQRSEDRERNLEAALRKIDDHPYFNAEHPLKRIAHRALHPEGRDDG